MNTSKQYCKVCHGEMHEIVLFTGHTFICKWCDKLPPKEQEEKTKEVPIDSYGNLIPPYQPARADTLCKACGGRGICYCGLV